MKNSDITDPLFKKAVDAIDRGDAKVLENLLQAHPDLVSRRLETPNEQGYFKEPYLLWFVADNPIRYPRLPANIVDITRLLVDALRKADVDNYQYIVNSTLGLVTTGRIPKESGVQIPLMDLLIDEAGAQTKGSVLGPIGQHNFEAASHLLARGSDYDLATAAGFGRMDDVKRLLEHSTDSQRYVALVVASFFGNSPIIAMLIDAGVEVNGRGTAKDFAGFHSHASALHQAVYSGSLESVKLLVNAGASLQATDSAYHGTPLGWAIYMREEEASSQEERDRFFAIEAFLKEHGPQ